MSKQITKFRGKHGFLSNMADCRINYKSVTYYSAEAAYQAQKTKDIEVQRRFTRMSAVEAKREGKKLSLRKDWENVKVAEMRMVLRNKFMDNKFKQLLLDTGKAEIIHMNDWKDDFWGVLTDGTGENWLGKLLMEIRDEIKAGRL